MNAGLWVLIVVVVVAVAVVAFVVIRMRQRSGTVVAARPPSTSNGEPDQPGGDR